MLLPTLELSKKFKLDIYFNIKDSGRNKISRNFVNNICDSKSTTIKKDDVLAKILKFKKLPVNLNINQSF